MAASSAAAGSTNRRTSVNARSRVGILRADQRNRRRDFVHIVILYGQPPGLTRGCEWNPVQGVPMRPCVLALALTAATLPALACNNTAADKGGSPGAGTAAVKRASFGTLPDGAVVGMFSVTKGRSRAGRPI